MSEFKGIISIARCLNKEIEYAFFSMSIEKCLNHIDDLKKIAKQIDDCKEFLLRMQGPLQAILFQSWEEEQKVLKQLLDYRFGEK